MIPGFYISYEKEARTIIILLSWRSTWKKGAPRLSYLHLSWLTYPHGKQKSIKYLGRMSISPLSFWIFSSCKFKMICFSRRKRRKEVIIIQKYHIIISDLHKLWGKKFKMCQRKRLMNELLSFWPLLQLTNTYTCSKNEGE